MIREQELNDEIILKTLAKNPLGRNEQLNNFIELINSINKNTTISVDGGWGSGKTVFVKQLEYLSRNNPSTAQTLAEETISDFQDKYDVYYFNAWENDFHHDPLQSILFSLINDTWSKREKLADKTVKLTRGLRDSVSKVASLGIYDAKSISEAKSITDLAKDITTASERKAAIDDILSNYLVLTGKRLLFIIDELDRCRPTYAVNLLEVIKHYYTDDRLVFMLATNNEQLSHTVKKVYGQTFDGPAYLTKFYDLIFNLPDLEPKSYIKYLGYRVGSGYWKDAAPIEVVEYLELSIREINRYYSSLKLIENFFEADDIFFSDDYPHQIVKYILIPLAFGLRIKGSEDYDKFISGKSTDLIRDFYQSSTTVQTITARMTKDQAQNVGAVNILADTYSTILNKKLKDVRENSNYISSANTFKKVVLLMNATGRID